MTQSSEAVLAWQRSWQRYYDTRDAEAAPDAWYMKQPVSECERISMDYTAGKLSEAEYVEQLRRHGG